MQTTKPSPTTSTTPTFKTADLYFAAFLKVAGVPYYDAVTVLDKGRAKVVFEFCPDDMGLMRDLKRQYFSGHATVSAHDHTQAIKMMKQLTHMAR